MGGILETMIFCKKPSKETNRCKMNKMTIKDIPQIIEIYKSYWGTIGLYKYSTFEKIINQNISFVYKINNEIISFCLISYAKEKNIAEIALLCVKKEYKRKHLGQSILSSSIEFCKNIGIKNFCLHVSTTNYPAINLYEKLGFINRITIYKYYHDKNPKDNDAYYMTLDI
jgi:ribosomal protein S18 acetylase RimI-like enzyme